MDASGATGRAPSAAGLRGSDPASVRARSSLATDRPYRPDIDGLRALAVLAVVLFHADLGIPGGYVGVDVFFVISGYLITSLILRDLRDRSFTLAHFWERRARRILPVASVVTMTTLAVGWFVMLPSDYARLGRSAFWQALFASNVHFWRETSYFADAAVEQPLLHTWSLAVEEQFYWIYPLLLMLLHRSPRWRRPSALLAMLAFGGIVSLAAGVVLSSSHHAAAFYLLPTRAWELLMGGILALAPEGLRPKGRAGRETLSYVGLVGVLYPCFAYTHATPFPGIAAVLPCLSTALIMIANQPSTGGEASSSLGRCLSARPIVFVGLISYSLYLWHWPILAFSTYCDAQPLGIERRLCIVVLALVLATVSWRYLERPFRRRTLATSRRAMFAYAAGGIVTVASCAAIVATSAGLPARLPAEALLYDGLQNEMPFTALVNPRDAAAGRLIRIGNASPDAPVKILVWGDSHAMAIVPAVESLCRERAVAGEAATYSSTAPLLDYHQPSRFGLTRDEAITFNRSIFQHVERLKIPDVLLAALWSGYGEQDTSSTDLELDRPFRSALLATVRRLRETGARVWILEQVPGHPMNVRRALALHAIFGSSDLPAGTPASNDHETHRMGDLRGALKAAGAHLLDPCPFLLDPGTGRFRLSNGGPSLYQDDHHLSLAGALFIRELFRPAVND